MRQEPNNSIDLLLRQLGRQDEIFTSDLDEQHLDADELNSYVANALPAKTRARYMQHIVDCSTCRKMVAQLSAAEGVMAVQQPATVAGPSGLKSFLASLFSPMVLRYAVPALGVIVLTVVGVVMFRETQQQRAASVAQVTTSADQKSYANDKPAAQESPAADSSDGRLREGLVDQTPKAGVAAPAPAPETPTGPTVAKTASPEDAERQPEPEKKAASTADKSDIAHDANQPLNTEEAKVGQEPPKETAKKAKQQSDEVAAAPPPVAVPGNAAPRRAKLGEAAGTGSVASTQAAGNAPQARQEASRERKDETTTGLFSYAETRSVAGRQFVKRGEVWFDAAYKSSQSTALVTRGTEQYRALIADEPEIHTIAENLKSEFVVVWKGRAYRVR